MSRTADTDDGEALATVGHQLTDLVDAMEQIDWRDVPTVSVYEAAAWNARVAEARDAVRDQAATDGGDGGR